MKFLVLATSVVGTTNLNNEIYFVKVTDKDNIVLFKYNPENNSLENDFTVNITGTYIGGGVVALFPRFEIETKDFNPMKQIGQNIKTSYIDFLFDTSTSSAINIIMKMNNDINSQGNMIVGNKNIETCNVKVGNITDIIIGDPGEDIIIMSKNHGLLNRSVITIQDVQGSTELNGNEYSVTFISVNQFSINQDSSGVSAYEEDGYWQQVKQEYWTLSSKYTWHRFFSTCYGQYFSIILTNSNEQMAQLRTHQQNFVLNAMQIFYLPGGKNIFGR
jgi:hypothetical protein